ncbi:MAG: glycerol-3-phosphate acyltransferase [Chloroflexota bacterium]|nr:glycerol-3-phosphate acyltransferase [Chloroflexota bacterium]MBI5704778.1 glycerol-3-phosphate acyltransferase [Chloroflexota bacterium]
MQTWIETAAVVLGYLLGSIPFGLLIVKVKTGRDLREIESGRTGGTNTLRAAGFWAGLLTAILDILKGAASVWIAQRLAPGNHLVQVLAPVAAILGHNYSIFLIRRDEDGRLRFHGGAGGAPALGGAVGLWLPMFPIAFSAGALIFFTVGIASVTTMSIALIVTIVFAIRAYLGLQNPIDILYGVLALFLLGWALRPNIKKLIEGKERVVSISLHGWLKARREAKQSESR